MSKENMVKRLEILDTLLESATPSEQAYYGDLRQRIERQIARFESQVQKAPDSTPEELAATITSGYQGLHSFEWELSRDLDPHWRAFYLEQKEKRIAALRDLEVQLRATGYAYTPPEYDAAAEEKEAHVIDREVRIDELKHFRRLLTAWGERNGQAEIPELSGIDLELAELTGG